MIPNFSSKYDALPYIYRYSKFNKTEFIVYYLVLTDGLVLHVLKLS